MPRFKAERSSRSSITVDDPCAFNKVWTGIQICRLVFEGNSEETTCAENNGLHFAY